MRAGGVTARRARLLPRGPPAHRMLPRHGPLLPAQQAESRPNRKLVQDSSDSRRFCQRFVRTPLLQ